MRGNGSVVSAKIESFSPSWRVWLLAGVSKVKHTAQNRGLTIDGSERLDSYFRQLTERFLVPLYRYNNRRGRAPWSTPDFLASLNENQYVASPLRFRSRGLISKSRIEQDFYATFCMSGNFASWLLELEATAAPPAGDYNASARPSIESDMSSAVGRRASEDSSSKMTGPRRGSVV